MRWPLPYVSPRFFLVPAALAAFCAAERAWPLRRRVEPGAARVGRNLAIAGLAAAVIQLTEVPMVLALTALVERERWGLLNWLPLPDLAKLALAVALMDYTLYAWHYLTHKVPLLWRVHRVHHADLDLDATTGARFHFAEHLASLPWRAAQIVLIGVGTRAFLVWQAFLMANVLFHHANLRLPLALERALAWIVVTPRLHGIHHSIERSERDANWSSGLTVWDRLHGTLRTDVPQERIVIGVRELRTADEVSFARMIRLPARPPTP